MDPLVQLFVKLHNDVFTFYSCNMIHTNVTHLQNWIYLILLSSIILLYSSAVGQKEGLYVRVVVYNSPPRAKSGTSKVCLSKNIVSNSVGYIETLCDLLYFFHIFCYGTSSDNTMIMTIIATFRRNSRKSSLGIGKSRVFASRGKRKI